MTCIMEKEKSFFRSREGRWVILYSIVISLVIATILIVLNRTVFKRDQPTLEQIIEDMMTEEEREIRLERLTSDLPPDPPSDTD